MYIAPRKYPGSRANSKPQTGQRKCILGHPRNMEWWNIVPRRQRGHRWPSMSFNVSHTPLLIGAASILSLLNGEAFVGSGVAHPLDQCSTTGVARVKTCCQLPLWFCQTSVKLKVSWKGFFLYMPWEVTRPQRTTVSPNCLECISSMFSDSSLKSGDFMEANSSAFVIVLPDKVTKIAASAISLAVASTSPRTPAALNSRSSFSTSAV